MKKNNNLPAFVFVSLVIGYLFGGLVGIPGVDSQLLSGDIKKVNHQVSEEAQMFQEKLETDSAFREETITALGVIDSRVNDFKDLTDSTAIVAQGIKELQENVVEINAMKVFAKEAQLQADSALVMLLNVANGTKQISTDYEKMARDAMIAYLLMDRQKEVARNLIDKVDAYLYNNSKNVALANLRNKWVVFCGDGAALDGDKSDVAYWNDKDVMKTMGGQPLDVPQGLVVAKVGLGKGSNSRILGASLNERTKETMRENDVNPDKLQADSKLMQKVEGGSLLVK